MRRVRFTTSHPRDFVKEIIDAIDRNEFFAITCICPYNPDRTEYLPPCSASTHEANTCGASNG